jgi:hypothetical protein
LSSIILLSLGEVDNDEEGEATPREESLGTIIAFSVGVPLSILFTTIAAVYVVRDRDIIKFKNNPIYWVYWFFVINILIVVSSLIWGFAGVIWFLFETSVLALLFQPIILTLNPKLPNILKKSTKGFLVFLSLIFLVLTIALFNEKSRIENFLNSDKVFLEIMVGGFILILITIWSLYLHLKASGSAESKLRLELLPLMFITAMLILYFEVVKGLFKESQITWIGSISISIEFLTPIILFFAAIFNLTQDILQYADIDVNLPDAQLSIRSGLSPYSYILGIYVLYLSKFFYVGLLNLEVPFLYAAITFTFVSIFVLNYTLKKSLESQ